MKKILILISICFSILISQEEVSGIVSGTWSVDNSPYLVVGDLQVNPYTSLTIDPGVEVIFDDTYEFKIEGELHAIGTEQDSINFRPQGEASYLWNGINFEYSTGLSEISYANIQATQGHAIKTYYSNPLIITHSTFYDCQSKVLHFENTFAQITLSNLLISTSDGSDGIYADECLLSLDSIAISGDSSSNGIYYRGNYQLSANNIDVQNFSRGFNFYNADNFVHLITNSQITNNVEGIYINNGSSVSVSDSEISNNSNGIYITGSHNTLTLTDSNIHNNSNFGIGSEEGGNHISASGTSVWDNVSYGISVFGSSNQEGNSDLILNNCDIFSNFRGIEFSIFYDYNNSGINYSIVNTNIYNNEQEAFYIFYPNSSYIYNNASTKELTGCNIYGNGGPGFSTNLSTSSSDWYQHNRALITNSTIQNNQGNGVMFVGEIRNSLIAGNTGWGVYGSYADIINSTITTNDHGVWKIGDIVNSIIFFNGEDQIYDLQGSATYSNIMGGYDGEGNMDQNPGFWDYVDYELHPSSPCIDAGNPSSDYYDICFPPSQGTTINDMGVYGGLGACGLSLNYTGGITLNTNSIDFGINIVNTVNEYLLEINTFLDTEKEYELSIIDDDGISASQFLINDDTLTFSPGINVSYPINYTPTLGGDHIAALTIQEISDNEGQYFEINLEGSSINGNVVSGSISGAWDIDNSPYLVVGDLQVNPYTSLTIDPGVEVVFMEDYQFKIEGELHAVGTEQDSIYFRSDFPGQSTWQGINFQYSTGLSEISYADIQSTSGNAVYTYYSNPVTITHSKFYNCNNTPLYFENTFAQITLSNLLISTSDGSDGIYADECLLSLDSIAISGDSSSNGIYYRGNYQLSANNIDVQNFSRGFNFYNADNFVHLITNSQITNNVEGIYINNGSSVSVSDSEISNNSNGIYITGSHNTLTLTDSNIHNNSNFGIGSEEGGNHISASGTSVWDNVSYGISVFGSSNQEGNSDLILNNCDIFSNFRGIEFSIFYDYNNSGINYSIVNTNIYNNEQEAFYIFYPNSSYIYNNASTKELTGCNIYGNGGPGFSTNLSTSSSDWYQHNRALITNSTIQNNQGNGVMFVGEIRNSLIAGNTGWGVYGSYADIINSTITTNDHGVWKIGDIVNSIIFFNGEDQIYDLQGSATYSNIMGGYDGEGNMDQNPGFWDYVDYELHPSSPCIDAGNPSSDYYDICFPPSQGTTINDMGAYGGGDACNWPIPGCTDSEANNYNPGANTDDGSCLYDITYGDLNEDGIIDVIDVVMLVNLVMPGDYNESGDMNTDGVLNVLDIVELVNLILNI